MSSPMTDPDAGPINRAATFHPSRNDDEIPAVEVAGVLVFVYLDAAGTLRVTVDTESADERPEWRYGVRMRVNVNSGTVFEGSDTYGADGDHEIIRHNTDSQPAVIVRPNEPIHVFGDINVIMGRHGAAEKLAELDDAPTGKTATCRHCGDVIAETGDHDWSDADGYLGCPARDSSKPHVPLYA